MILDTNALSAIADAEPGAVAMLNRGTEVMLPVIAVGEYWYGIKQSRYRAKCEEWILRMISKCRVLDVDMRTAEASADIRVELRRKGQPIPYNHIWIAALGRQHDLPILGRDRHYDAVSGILRISW